jgi:hypothetical protein
MPIEIILILLFLITVGGVLYFYSESTIETPCTFTPTYHLYSSKYITFKSCIPLEKGNQFGDKYTHVLTTTDNIVINDSSLGVTLTVDNLDIPFYALIDKSKYVTIVLGKKDTLYQIQEIFLPNLTTEEFENQLKAALITYINLIPND